MQSVWLLLRFFIVLTLSTASGSDEVVAEMSNECATTNEEGSEQCQQQQQQEEERKLLHPHERDFYINGTWIKPNEQQQQQLLLDVIDPSTAKTISFISMGNQNDVDIAVNAAQDALHMWSSNLQQRISLIKKLHSIYKRRKSEMAKLISIEMGAPIDFAYSSQAQAGIWIIEEQLESIKHFQFERTVPGLTKDDASTTLVMEPVGVVGMITPWNWPMNQVTLKVIPALLVGCTCILKPSEVAPLSSLLFAEMVHEAGFPPGVFNLINGDGPGVGTLLSKHPNIDMISFTGSTRAGRLVSQNAAETFKRVSLELGGKGANIIFDDIGSGNELKRNVRSNVWNCYGNSGQSCNAPTRMLVQTTIYDEAVRYAKIFAEEEVVGSAHDHGDFIGPVVSQTQYDRVQHYIQLGIEEGARLVTGGLGRPTDAPNQMGYYVKPTVFADVLPNMTIAQEEIFGPVLSIMKFETEQEAIDIANGTPYGLTNYVQTKNTKRLRRMARALKSGMVQMNGNSQDDGSPFGGMKASGSGREGGVYGMEEFCHVKAITGLP